MSTTSTMAASPGLLQLPPELLLNIATRLVGDPKDIHHARHLLSLALVCRQLAPVAREALCVNPILESRKVHTMLRLLFIHPELAVKIKTLTIETEMEGDEYQSTNLDRDLWRQCERHIQSLPALPFVRNNLKKWLDSGYFITRLLLTLLPTVLPNINQLYLGGAVLNNLPWVQNLVANKSFFGVYNFHTSLNWPPSAESDSDLVWVLHDIGPKLTALELPVDMWRYQDMWRMMKTPRFDELPTVFPKLRWLGVPHIAILPIMNMLRKEDGLRSLETLVLTDVFCICSVKTLTTLLLEKEQNPSLLPQLSEVKLYYRSEKNSINCVGDPGAVLFPKQLTHVGIQVYEYIPGCCLRVGDEYHHPWKYTKSEMDARQDERHSKLNKSSTTGSYCGCVR